MHVCNFNHHAGSDSEMNGNSIVSDADAAPLNGHSALDLLALAYGDPSDSDEDVMNIKNQVPNVSNELINHTIESQPYTSCNGDYDGTKVSSSSKECQQGPLSQSSKCIGNSNTLNGPKGVHTRNKDLLKMVLSEGFQPKYIYIQKRIRKFSVNHQAQTRLQWRPLVAQTIMLAITVLQSV